MGASLSVRVPVLGPAEVKLGEGERLQATLRTLKRETLRGARAPRLLMPMVRQPPEMVLQLYRSPMTLAHNIGVARHFATVQRLQAVKLSSSSGLPWSDSAFEPENVLSGEASCLFIPPADSRSPRPAWAATRFVGL